MMLSHPVLLGILWSLLFQLSSGQAEISNKDNNQVYAYTYHFQHNGTTNSQEILRSVLGGDPEFGVDPADGKSIVKTFSSPNIRGFFTKGFLPAGPINQNYNSGFRAPINTNSEIERIKNIVHSNLQPPVRNAVPPPLPPISPDIEKEFPGDFNSVNHIDPTFQNQNDFPKIPPPSPPVINNNNGISRVQAFSRNTPDGGKVVGQVETFAYNPPPVVNSGSKFQENSEGFRRNENILNNNQEVTGHRTQSYFRQHFRTVSDNLDNNNNIYPSNRIGNRNNVAHNGNNNNNQWWNVLNVLGGNNNNNNNNVETKPASPQLNEDIDRNINEIKNNLNNRINRAFGTRLSSYNRQSFHNNLQNNNRQDNFRNNVHNNYNAQNRNFNQNVPNNVPFQNRPIQNAPLIRQIPNPNVNNQQHNNNNNNIYPNPPINNVHNNNNNNQGPNYNNQFNQDTERKVMNFIQDVNSHLNNLHGNTGQRGNNIGLTWDDDIAHNFNADWSSRRSNGRPFSNAHSGPAAPKPVEPVEILKTTLEALSGGRNFQIPSITGNQGGNYRNAGGGGVEKFFGSDRVVEGPNSYSRNQQRGFERNFQVNSNSGYQRSNQWSTNTVRRLDAQSSKEDFSKDFIDVFRDDY